MVKLTRRQWLILPVEMKLTENGRRKVLMSTEQGTHSVPVTFVKRLADSDFQIEVT